MVISYMTYDILQEPVGGVVELGEVPLTAGQAGYRQIAGTPTYLMSSSCEKPSNDRNTRLRRRGVTLENGITISTFIMAKFCHIWFAKKSKKCKYPIRNVRSIINPTQNAVYEIN